MSFHRWLGTSSLLLAVTSFSALCVERAASQTVADDPLTRWAEERGLDPGLNAEARVFVARGVGGDRLSCLIAALGEFARFLESEVTVTRVVEDQGVAAGVVTARARHRLTGYEIESEQVLADGDDPKLELLTIVKKHGKLFCVLSACDRGQGPVETSFPSIDVQRRAAVENELVEVFIKESFLCPNPGGERMQGIFVIDCDPLREPPPAPRPE